MEDLSIWSLFYDLLRHMYMDYEDWTQLLTALQLSGRTLTVTAFDSFCEKHLLLAPSFQRFLTVMVDSVHLTLESI